MDSLQLRRIAKKWALMVLALSAATALVAFAVSDSLTPVYEANGSLEVVAAPQQQQQTSSFTATASQVTSTYAVIMTAYPLLGQVIKDLNLPQTPEQLAPHVSVTPDRDTEILQVKVSDTDPRRAATIANTLMTDFVASVAKQHQAQIAQAGTALTKLIDDTKADLAKSEQQLAALKPGESSTVLSDRITADHNSLTQLTTNFSTFSATQAQTLDNVVPVSSAPIPSSAASPKTLLNTAIGGIAGLLLGVAAALLLEYFDQGLRSEDDVQRHLGLATLGCVPNFSTDGDGGKGDRQRNAQAAEAYRRLRTNLRFCAVDGSIKSVVITSSRQGEGKTSTSANLARIVAASGERVLLLDADMRRPTQHRLFSKPLQNGMSEMLLGAATAPARRKAALASVNGAHATDVPNLSLVTAGVIPPNPAELLASKQAPQVLSALAATHDLVVVDTPPIDAVTDALGLAAGADATVVVIKSGGSVRSAQKTIGALQRVGANVVGVVINRARDRAGEGYYYYYEGYSSGPAPEGAGGGGNGPSGGGNGTVPDAVRSWTPLSWSKRPGPKPEAGAEKK